MRFDKAAFELDVFAEFARISGLAVEDNSIQQLEPPYPDIVCRISGETHGFELTLLTDQQIEKKVRNQLSGYSNFKVEPQDVANAIKKKSEKRYVPNVPTDLVIQEGATPIDSLWLYSRACLDDIVKLEIGYTPFTRVWLVDMSSEKILMYENTFFAPG